MRFYFLILTIYILPLQSIAQNISGKVVDQEEIPIPFANIDVLENEKIIRTVSTNQTQSF